MWDLPRSGTEPVFPTWAGGFFTTNPSGKPQNLLFKKKKQKEGQWIWKKKYRDFPGSSVVKNLPSSAGDEASIPGRATKPRGHNYRAHVLWSSRTTVREKPRSLNVCLNQDPMQSKIKIN